MAKRRRKKLAVEAMAAPAAKLTAEQKYPLPKIVSFVAASQPAFQLAGRSGEVSVFLGDPERSSTMDSLNTANAHSLSSSASGILYPLYSADQPFYRSPTCEGYYRRADDCRFAGIAGVGNDLFMLGAAQQTGSLAVSADVLPVLSADNGVTGFEANEMSTVAYLSDSVAAWLAGSGEVSVEQLQAPSCYQTLYEIPASVNQDFQTSKVLAHAYPTKSFMDSQFTMDPASQRECGCQISSCRRYSGIGSCGGKLYLVYFDDQPSGRCSYGIGLPRIETVANLRRISGGQHQRIASLYSLDVATALVDSIVAQTGSLSGVSREQKKQFAERLEMELRNGIAQIADSAQPAQLQLFDVKLNGKSAGE